MPVFVPSVIQNVMLSIIAKAKAQGLNITADTVISTAFTWPLAHNYWFGRGNSWMPQSIGYVTEQWDALVASGTIPQGSISKGRSWTFRW
jgi:hypothetical protein